MWSRSCAIAALALLLTACATPVMEHEKPSSFAIAQERRVQEEMVIAQEVQEKDRLDRVAWPLIVANTELCPAVRPSLGFSAWDMRSYPAGARRDLAMDALGLTDRATVRAVMPGGPAEQAGIQPGDAIGAVNGRRTSDGKKARSALGRAMKGGKPVTLALTRPGRAYEVMLAPVQTCNYPISYKLKMGKDADKQDKAKQVNAWADGKKLIFTPAMVRFARDDGELALVIAHEMAHNILNHPEKNMRNMGPGLILEATMGIARGFGIEGAKELGELGQGYAAAAKLAYSVNFEREADYVGMYILARAGGDTSKAAGFWRRMAVEEYGRPNRFAVTHPTTPERFLNLKAIHEEIAAKQAAGEELRPEPVVYTEIQSRRKQGKPPGAKHGHGH